MKISVSVMAHPDRTDGVRSLLAALGRDVPVSWDDEGPVSGNADRIWRNARAAWEMRAPDSDWHILLQDDALVCDYFLAGMDAALRHVQGPAVVSPYLGMGGYQTARWRNLAERAAREKAAFVRTGSLRWGVCIALPTLLIPDMIAYGDTRANVPDDMRVAGWAERRRYDVWYTWPSLVDHASVPSLTKHRAKDRRAWLHHRGSAMDIDWSGPVITDPSLAMRRGQRSGPGARTRHAALPGTLRR